MPIGSLIKTIAVYDTPFWRSAGLNGQVTSDTGPVTVMFDASPASGTPGVLLGFIDGDDARQLSDQSAAARATAALKSYATYFGQQAGNPRMYFDQVWDKEIYTGGCPVGLMPPGVMIEYGGALRAETATVWTGYMDGAVQAGKRAASEALAAL
jgi:monoamine oxidase